MTLRLETKEQLDELFDKRQADRIAPKADKAPPRKAKSERESGSERRNVLENNVPSHVIALRVVVAVIAYFLLAVGWTIGAIGDAIWEMGKRMHDDKWNIN